MSMPDGWQPAPPAEQPHVMWQQCGETRPHPEHVVVFTPWREIRCAGLDGTEVGS